MNSLGNLFSPLGKEYCVYFYAMSVFGLLSFVATIVSMLYLLMKKKLDTYSTINSFTLLVSTLLSYFVNRLMYTMCAASVM
jgi:uncharacterized membrane protein YcgQ (UPF0703/DUF1980 family)